MLALLLTTLTKEQLLEENKKHREDHDVQNEMCKKSRSPGFDIIGRFSTSNEDLWKVVEVHHKLLQCLEISQHLTHNGFST